MPTERRIKDVPALDVDKKMRILKQGGAITVAKEKQPNGKYTIVATFP